jgi:hypothetical protein
MGCSSHQSKGNTNSIAYVTTNVALEFPAGTTDIEKALLLEAAEIQVKEFELDWGTEVTYTKITLFRSETIPCADLPGVYAGCHHDNGVIHAIMGDRFHIPVIYHELVHHMIQGHDYNHQDPRWSAMWTPRQNAIANGIWANRS